jgi:hypothetical protein
MISSCKSLTFQPKKNIFKGDKMTLMKEKDDVLNCPRDQTPMIKEIKRGVTIDRCLKCGGVWMDKGEMISIALRREVELRKAEKAHKAKLLRTK